MKSLVDRNAKDYIEVNGITTPDMNAEPWVSPLVILKLIAGESTSKRNLKYSWELEDFEETSLTVRITFVTPMKISQNEDPERLYIELRIQEFHDKDGFGIEHQTNFTVTIPPQLPNDATSQALADASETTETGGQLIMSTNLLINTVLSASVQSLCQLMNGLQLIVHLPLLKIIFPPNVLMFILPLVNVANFDIIPVHLVYPYVFDFQASKPYNQ